MKKIIYTIATYLFVGCATPTTVQDNKDGSIYIFSQTDPASNDKRISSDLTTQNVIKKLENNLKSNPSDVESMITLANIYIALSDSGKSIYYAKLALRFDLKEHRARLILAQNYYRQKKFKLAEVVLASLPPEYNKDPDVINMRALIAYKRNHKGKSWQLFKSGTEEHPTHVAMSMNYAVLLLKYRQTVLAKTYFEKVIDLVPDHNDAKVHLAIIDATNGDYDSAFDKIESLTSPKNRLYKFNLGMIAFEKKDYRTAEIFLRRLLGDKSSDKMSIDSATEVLEKISKQREKDLNEKLKNKQNSLGSKLQKQSGQEDNDEEIKALEKEITE